MKKNIGVKSRRLYEIGSYSGFRHYISLVWREYASGKSIYIVKVVIVSRDGKTIYKNVYHNEQNALNALKELIIKYTFFNIETQISLPI